MSMLRKAYHKVFPTYVHVLRKHLKGCESVLELGCGKGSPLKHVPKTFYSVGVDAYEPAIEESKALKIHDEYVVSDVLNTNFSDKSFDCVVALDLIEHLKKEDGLKLVKEMERLAKKKIIVFTPHGFLPQGSIDNNDLQEHLSGWEVDEMRKLGFKVYGISGWKPLRGERAVIKYRPKKLWELVSILSSPFVYKMPKQAFQMFCVKRIGK
jgi:ubiquinone/menaquinone biosynthesis C-methylase UbiE